MEIKCCEIALAAIIVNLISLLFFFGYSVRINGKDKAILFSGDKNVLPVNLQAPANYDKKYEEKISQLEKIVKQLQSQIQNSKENNK